MTSRFNGHGAGGEEMRRNPPIFNAPTVVLALIAVFIAVQVLLEVVSPALKNQIFLTLAFIPLRYVAHSAQYGTIPGGQGAAVWTFVTHALVHGGWLHLGINSVWMLAFGSVLARRLGTWRFLVFSSLAAACGAAVFLLLNWGQLAVMIGASGAISGQMAGSVRLIFALPGGLRGIGTGDLSLVRPLTLAETFTNRGALIFLGVWLLAALGTGWFNINPGAPHQAIAWEAHLGGFIAGLFLFGLLDRRPPRP